MPAEIITVKARSKCTLRLFILIVLFTTSHLSLADSRYRSKLGLDVSAFKPNLNKPIGWLTGVNWGRYLGDSQVYWGFGAYFGTPNGRALTEEYLTFGGLLVGWEVATSKRSLFEFDLLVGYGQGEKKPINLKQNSYYVAQPGAAFGFKLGQGWKILFAAHYVHMADAEEFSGPSFGIRIEFKSLSTSKFIND